MVQIIVIARVDSTFLAGKIALSPRYADSAKHSFFMTWFPLEDTAQMQDGYRKVFRLAGHHLLLLHHDGRSHLLDNICPHAGYPMDAGKVIDNHLRCPMHGYLFDLDNGNCLEGYEGPCNGVRVYALEQRAGQLGVEL
jgi:nitrite reductase/ring-hydroxylating ferredoxin subunit